MKRFPTFFRNGILALAIILAFIHCPPKGGKGLLFFPPSPEDTSVKGIVVYDESSTQYASGSTYVIGSVVQNTTGTSKTLTIKNNGSATVTLTGSPSPAVITGAHAAQFILDSQPSTTELDPGDSTEFEIHFSPDNSTGVKTAILTINSDDPIVGNFSLNISGTSTPTPVPRIEVKVGSAVLTDDASGSKQTFSTQENTTSSARTITVKNTGTLALTLSPAVDLTGTDTSYFVVTQPGNTNLAPNASTTFTIKFSPNNTTTRTAKVQIHSNDPNVGNFRIQVEGTGTPTPYPKLKLTYVDNGGLTEDASTSTPAAPYSFGTLVTGKSSPTKTFTIQNVGDASTTLNIDSVSVNDTTNYTISAVGSTTLAQNASTTFTVKFNPTTTGTKNAVLTVNTLNGGTAGAATSSTINLTGAAGAAQLNISWANAKEKAVHRGNGGYKVCYKAGSTFTNEGDSGVSCVSVPYVSGSFAPNTKSIIVSTASTTYYIKVKSFSEYNTGSAFSTETTVSVP